MKINLIKLNSFKGCVPPYTNAKGYKVTPIAKNPTQEDIFIAQNAVNDSQNQEQHGRSGSAHFYQDLVVKVSYPNRDNYLQQEIQALDKLYDSGVRDNPNIQEGLFGFVDPKDNKKYLVTKKLTGTPIKIDNGQLKSGTLTKENIESAVLAIAQMDYPSSNGKKLTKTNLPFNIPMHYDLCFENILVTPKKAQILDFEHFQLEDMENRYISNELGYVSEINCNLSDIPQRISNLRGFELRTLLPCLMALDNYGEAKWLFRNYIQNKSQYHQLQADKLAQLNPDNINIPCKKLEEKHRIHSRVLKNAQDDILESEVIKIQLAHYIHIQSEYDTSCTRKFNPKQIREYVNYAYNRFSAGYFNSLEDGDYDKKEYYLDCLSLLKSYGKVIDEMRRQENSELFHQKLDSRYLHTFGDSVL